MDDLVRATEVRVFVADRVEAVRARCDDLLHARLVQCRDVFPGQPLKRVLVAHSSGGVSGARLAGSEDREVDTGHLHQLGGRHGGLARALAESGRAADPEEGPWRPLAGLPDSNTEYPRPPL